MKPNRIPVGRKKSGRKPIHGAAMTSVTMRLDAQTIRRCKVLGNGNISAGVRAAVQIAAGVRAADIKEIK
jgi:hypothetical protein